ncbi:MAG TPA: protein-export chaperone SecB [Chromatiaceae bacterium]|nr:protein-export chaperone SecB [Chromatiaceae bacterium]
MAEENQQDNRQFAIQRVYVKDISFETPMGAEAFQVEWKPNINLNLNNAAKDLGNGFHEVILTVTVTAKIDDKTAFLAEVQQAGIFMVQNFPQEELAPMFAIYCPNVLFPYAREAISDLVNKGSFPQLLLAPVNFEALYAQQMQQQEQKPN